MAYLLKEEHGFHILGLTVDNGFLGTTAKQNIKHIVDALNIDHVTLKPRPDLFPKIYSYNLMHPKFYQDNNEEIGYLSTTCHSCTTSMHSIMQNYAAKNSIPAIALAYSPDQIEYHFYKIPDKQLKTQHWYPRGLETDYFTDSDRALFWNPQNHPKNSIIPQVYFPFHVLPYPGSHTIQEILSEKKILKKGSANPIKSNCIMNILLIYLDQKRLGYNSYSGSISYQIRNGYYKKRHWILFFLFFELGVKTGLYRHVIMGRKIDRLLKKLHLSMDDILNAPPSKQPNTQKQSD